MRIGIASDHGGFLLKEQVKSFLLAEGHTVHDCGTHSENPADYPPIIQELARMVAENTLDRGVALCGSGLGASMVANKVPGIRCALCNEPYSAALSRQHNDANVLALGGRLIGKDMAAEILRVWLTTEFEGGRHQRRVDQIHALENPRHIEDEP